MSDFIQNFTIEGEKKRFEKEEDTSWVPFHVRPVTSWNGLVAISWPAAATPMMVDTPQPLWHASSAALWGEKYNLI